MDEHEGRGMVKPRFDFTLNLGHIVTAGSLIAAVSWWASQTEAQISAVRSEIQLVQATLDAKIGENRMRVEALDGRTSVVLRDIDRRLAEIQRAIETERERARASRE